MSSTIVRFAVASVTSLTLTGVLMAQGNPQTPPQPPRTDQTPAQRGSTADSVTLAGCLMQGKDVASLKQSTASAEDFFLTNAMPSGAATTSGGTAGTAAPATGTPPPSGEKPGGTRPSDAARAGGAMGSGKVYRISGLGKDELSKHINHQVEIQGRLSTGGAPSGTPSGTTPGATAGAAGASDIAGVIQAAAVKMVSATCTAKE